MNGLVTEYLNEFSPMEFLENEFVKIELINKIIYVYIKNIRIDLEVAQKIEGSRIFFQKEKPFLVITNITEVLEITNEARNYFKTSGSNFMLANAMVSNSYYNTLIANAYIMLNNQKTPLKLFTSVDKARNWAIQTQQKKHLKSWVARLMFWK